MIHYIYLRDVHTWSIVSPRSLSNLTTDTLPGTTYSVNPLYVIILCIWKSKLRIPQPWPAVKKDDRERKRGLHAPVICTVSITGCGVIVAVNPPGEAGVGEQYQCTECNLGHIGAACIQVTHYDTA